MVEILVVADLHVLSDYGLSLPEYNIRGGKTVKASEGQQRLYKYWEHLCKTAHEKKVKEVWVLGDVIAGLNPIERGAKKEGTLDDQRDVAVELLCMLPKNAVIKIYSGTPYHESIETKIMEQIKERLASNGFKAYFMGDWAYDKIGKRVFFVTHHSTGSIVYPESMMRRSADKFKVAYFDGKVKRVSGIVRGDKHFYSYIKAGTIHVIQCPCFQTFVPYAKALKYFEMYQPDLGGVFISVRGKEDHIEVQGWLYQPFHIDKDGKIIECEGDPERYVQI